MIEIIKHLLELLTPKKKKTKPKQLKRKPKQKKNPAKPQANTQILIIKKKIKNQTNEY